MALKYSTIVLQDGPIREAGVNGDQIDDVLAFVAESLREFNRRGAEPDHRTVLAIMHCEDALAVLAERTADRTARGVEGTSAA
jgi:hypothetical protein